MTDDPEGAGALTEELWPVQAVERGPERGRPEAGNTRWRPWCDPESVWSVPETAAGLGVTALTPPAPPHTQRHSSPSGFLSDPSHAPVSSCAGRIHETDAATQRCSQG
ncbi:hypothetical protein ACOMHN_002467 [Nucella lapillus]